MGKAKQGAADEDRGTAAQWLLSDKNPKLLPTPWLSPYEFEEFVERLLRAQRWLGAGVRHVAKVERWGTSGDDQDGIDLAGEFSDGTPAAWQCKHLDKLRPFEVRDAVQEVTYAHATEFYLVYSRVASAQARGEMKKHAGWTLLDRGQLTGMLRELPVQVQRDILGRTWGEQVRRVFVEAPGDTFVSLDTFVSARRNAHAVINDAGPRAAASHDCPTSAENLTTGIRTCERSVLLRTHAIADQHRCRLFRACGRHQYHLCSVLCGQADGLGAVAGLSEDVPASQLGRERALRRWVDGCQYAVPVPAPAVARRV